MTTSNSPILQILRVESDPEVNFEPRLALAVHRQSTSVGFLASLEGEVMAKANEWITLVGWSTVEDAKRAAEEWFESDYYSDFHGNIEAVLRKDLFIVSPDFAPAVQDSTYSTFMLVEALRPPEEVGGQETPGASSKEVAAARISELRLKPGYDAAFSYFDRETKNPMGIVSTWSSQQELRAARDAASKVEPYLSREEYLHARVTSNNV
jgi:heme-degrading monooxygenase HmoA